MAAMGESTRAPRVAVVIPFYDDAEFVRQAVDSVQEEEPVEIVVVDDASPDPAAQSVLDELGREGVRVIRHDANQGVSAARMTGVRASRAPYIFPLDADDLAIPGALASMADRLDAQPRTSVCFGDYIEFGDSELVRAVPERLDPYRIAYTDEYPATSLMRREALEQLGGWTSADVHEDWDLWMSIAEQGLRTVHRGPDLPIYRRRVHENRLGGERQSRHRQVYRELRDRHPKLFSQLREARRDSDMSRLRKLLYPIVYGGRRRLPGETRLRSLLAKRGVWTLRR